MTDLNALVQEFWMTSSDAAVGASFFAMHKLLEILEGCSHTLEVCSDIISVFATAILDDKIDRCPTSGETIL